jgi:hypothetical protein
MEHEGSTMKAGDIVKLAGRDGLWIYALARPGEPPVLTQAKFINALGQAITIGEASATLVVTPVFTPGETVTHEHQPAIVESDDGQIVVLVYSGRRVGVPPRNHDGENFTHEGRIIHSDRALLVRENLKKFINQENTTNVEI